MPRDHREEFSMRSRVIIWVHNTSCPKSPLCDMRSRRPNHGANEHQSRAIPSARPPPNTVSVPVFATPLVNKYWHIFWGSRQNRRSRWVAPTIERIDSGCASNLMRVLIRLTVPHVSFPAAIRQATPPKMRRACRDQGLILAHGGGADWISPHVSWQCQNAWYLGCSHQRLWRQ